MSLQRWASSFIPSWLWVKAVLYSHTKARKVIKLSRERNHEHQFTRRRHYIPPNYERARYNSTESRIPDLTLRRTPSPQRRISTIEPPGSPRTLRKLSTASLPSPFLDSQPMRDHSSGSDTATPTRPLSAGIHPTLWENPVTSTPLESGALLSPGGGVAPGGFRFNGTAGRRTSVVKVSRVLVIPSVARVSHHPMNRSRPGSPHPPTELRPHPQPEPTKSEVADST